MRSIRSYIPKNKHPDKTEMLHVRVPSEMKEKFFKIAKMNRFKPADVLRGAILKFIDDEQSRAS